MRCALIIFLGLSVAGCVTSPVYNPMPTAGQGIALNENGLKAIQDGMTMEEVHQAMGPELVTGYAFQSTEYKPLTVPNPYKSEAIKGSSYVIEYYIEGIHQPDGVVSDDELMPLIFKDGRLIGRGWPLANSVRQPKPLA